MEGSHALKPEEGEERAKGWEKLGEEVGGWLRG